MLSVQGLKNETVNVSELLYSVIVKYLFADVTVIVTVIGLSSRGVKSALYEFVNSSSFAVL